MTTTRQTADQPSVIQPGDPAERHDPVRAFRRPPPARRHPRLGRCADRDRRSSAARRSPSCPPTSAPGTPPSPAASPTSSTTSPRPAGRSPSSPTASTSTTPQVQRSITAGLARIAAIDGVLDVADPWSSGPAAEQLRADRRPRRAGRRHPRRRPRRGRRARASRTRSRDLAHGLDAPEVLVGGNVLVGETFQTASENDLLRGEAIALPIAIVIMVLLLGGLVAGGMPLLVALGGVIPTLAVLVAATRLGDVSIFSVNVVNMLGIGLGIDYGLLMVNRFREERGHGPRRARRRRGHRRLRRHDRRVLRAHRRGRHVRAVRVRRAAAHLVRHRRPRRRAAVHGRRRHAAARRRWPRSAGASSPLPPTPDVEGRFYRLARWVQGRPVAVGGAVAVVLVLLGRPVPRAPASRTATPAPCPARPRSAPPRSRSPTGSRPAAPTPSPSSPPSTPTDPAFDGVARPTSPARAGVAGTVDPARHPAGMTVVDFVPTGTSPRRQAHRAGRADPRRPPRLRHPGRRTRGRAHRRQGQARRPAADRRRRGRAWPPCCCCS